MTALGIIKIFGYVSQLVAAGLEVATAAKVAQAALEQMLADGRDPTDAELEAIMTRLDARAERIQNS